MLYFDRDDIELPEDTWFIQDVIGLEVYDADTGKCYGKVDDIYQNGTADVMRKNDASAARSVI